MGIGLRSPLRTFAGRDGMHPYPCSKSWPNWIRAGATQLTRQQSGRAVSPQNRICWIVGSLPSAAPAQFTPEIDGKNMEQRSHDRSRFNSGFRRVLAKARLRRHFALSGVETSEHAKLEISDGGIPLGRILTLPFQVRGQTCQLGHKPACRGSVRPECNPFNSGSPEGRAATTSRPNNGPGVNKASAGLASVTRCVCPISRYQARPAVD